MARNDFSVLTEKISSLPEHLEKNLETTVKARAVILAGDARKNCPVDTGDLRNSIEDFVEVGKGEISGGAVTTHQNAAFVEFGTGPTGTAVGHPLESKLGITRKTEPWLSKVPVTSENEALFSSLSEKEKEQGFAWRFVHGQEPIPFMYRAMEENRDDILEEFGAAVKEAIK